MWINISIRIWLLFLSFHIFFIVTVIQFFAIVFHGLDFALNVLERLTGEFKNTVLQEQALDFSQLVSLNSRNNRLLP